MRRRATYSSPRSASSNCAGLLSQPSHALLDAAVAGELGYAVPHGVDCLDVLRVRVVCRDTFNTDVLAPRKSW